MKSTTKSNEQGQDRDKRLAMNYGDGLAKTIEGTRFAHGPAVTFDQTKAPTPAELRQRATAVDHVTGLQFARALGWNYTAFVGGIGSGLLPTPTTSCGGTYFFKRSVANEFLRRLDRQPLPAPDR
jgi:hypothetical protein